MHENVPVRFGRGRLDSLATKGLAAYLIATLADLRLAGRVRGAGGADRQGDDCDCECRPRLSTTARKLSPTGIGAVR